MLLRLMMCCLALAWPASAIPPELQWSQLRVLPTPKPAPGLMFRDIQTRKVRSLERYRGQVVLLNIWATSCAPCLHEMPTLDKLQMRYGEGGLKVLPIAIDPTQNIPKIDVFFRRASLQALPQLIDPSRKVAHAFGMRSLPSTYLINRQGEVVAVMEAADDWFSDGARAVIEYMLRQDVPKEDKDDSLPPQIFDISL